MDFLRNGISMAIIITLPTIFIPAFYISTLGVEMIATIFAVMCLAIHLAANRHHNMYTPSEKTFNGLKMFKSVIYKEESKEHAQDTMSPNTHISVTISMSST